MEQPTPSSSTAPTTSTPASRPPTVGPFQSYQHLFSLFHSREACYPRLHQLERSRVSWRSPSIELLHATDIFLHITPFASRSTQKTLIRECEYLQKQAQVELVSCRTWDASQIRGWMAAGAVVSTETLQRALTSKADLPTILALLDHGLIPNDNHLRVALVQGDGAILKALLNAGARPTAKLLEELAKTGSEQQIEQLLQAGAFSKPLGRSPKLSRRNRSLAANYSQTEGLFKPGERGRKLVMSMIKSKRSPAAAWMIHRALETTPPDTQLISELLKSGAPATSYALARACECGDRQLVELLIDHGAHPKQQLAELMVALLPPDLVKKAFPKIFPVKGGAHVSKRALELAVRFSSTAVIRLFLGRGAQPDQRTLARAMLRPDCHTSLSEALTPKKLPSDSNPFFHRFQRWGVLWAPSVDTITPFLKVAPSEETLAIAVMRSRADFVHLLIQSKAPVTKRIQRLAVCRRGPEADKVVALLAQKNAFELCKLAVERGTTPMVKRLLATIGNLEPEQQKELLQAALLRPTETKGMIDLFLDPDNPLPKELIYNACEEASLPTIKRIFSTGVKVTRYAIEKALRRPDTDPKPALWLCSQRQGKIEPDLPNEAFPAISYQSERIRAFYKLMEGLSGRGPFGKWRPDEVIIKLTKQIVGRAIPFTPRAVELNLKHKPVSAKEAKALCTAAPQEIKTDAEAKALAEHSPRLEAIKCGPKVTDEGLQALAKGCPQLKIVSMKKCVGVTDKGVIALAAGCSQLQSVDLSGTYRREMKVTHEGAQALAEKCPQLQIINLEHNNIGDEGTQALGAALSKNSSLTRLNLRGNNVGVEGAQALGAALAQNSSLTRLNLESNNVGDEGAQALGAGLSKNSSLTRLNLDANHFGDEGAKAFGAALSKNSSLTQLYLNSSNVDDEGVKALGAALAQNSSLTLLDLGYNNVGDEGAQALGVALSKNSSLTQLELRDNNVGDEGAQALGVALAQNSSLTQLELESNNVGDEGAQALGAGLSKNNSLTQLDLEYNNVGVEGAQALGALLSKNSSLTRLNLEYNNVGVEGAQALGAALAQNSSLTRLKLRSNNVGDEGAQALGAALAQNSSLTLLDLGYNNVGDEGAKAFGAALSKNSSLTLLDLRNNNVGVEGAQALGAALAQNSSLTELNLASNRISNKGVQALGAALAQNSSLTELNLEYNKVGVGGVEGAQALGAALAQNSSLTWLNLASNRISDEGAQALGAALSKNSSLTLLDLQGNQIRLVRTILEKDPRVLV